ncbi:LuxR C-terminal-related transcriptional regulator [Spirosoma fluviale]|uniref:Regulatory protein, luxR family n=1 Tax=Spirosoma fluviale TaxID=1597977 RepID=A0A286F8A2_9BACT|nr:LuxR C-terminal-related transcriptional regulator [Spirosoma fluviale]SOD79458.1 regulatory protein, luxR family [Spirosoma fluviale]
MSLLALCHRRSTVLKIAAAVDEAALNWRIPPTTIRLFQEQIVAQSPGFALISNDHLEDPALFTTIRAASPNTYIVVCLIPETVMTNTLWAVLDNLEFDVLCTLDELADCLITLKAGRFYKSSLLQTQTGYTIKEPLPGFHELTPGERRLLKLMTESKTGPQIADVLFISEKTVNNHKAKISQKLNVTGGPGSLTRFVLLHREELSQ